MEITDTEKRTLEAVLNRMFSKQYVEISEYMNTSELCYVFHFWKKLRYEQYCENRGISYEDMTVEDFAQAEKELASGEA